MKDKELRSQLVTLLKGGQSHIAPRDALGGVAAANRTALPSPDTHSLWELVEHLRLTFEDILRYIHEPSWESPAWPDGYWPDEADEVTDDQWEVTVAGMYAMLEKMVTLVNDPAIDLTAQIPHGQPGHTYLREVLLAADHNSYMLGQIVLTRKLLEDWPC